MKAGKKVVVVAAALTALTCLAVSGGCQHYRDGSSGTGTGGTIDRSGTMDQGYGRDDTGLSGPDRRTEGTGGSY